MDLRGDAGVGVDSHRRAGLAWLDDDLTSGDSGRVVQHPDPRGALEVLGPLHVHRDRDAAVPDQGDLELRGADGERCGPGDRHGEPVDRGAQVAATIAGLHDRNAPSERTASQML